MKADFSYKHEIFDLTTANKQRSFYYRLSKSSECWGNYTARVAFYNAENKLLYHRRDRKAHFIEMEKEMGLLDENMGFIKWSEDGTAAIFYEFKRGGINDGGIYDYLLLDFNNNIAYRINSNKYDCKFLGDLRDNFNRDNVIYKLIDAGAPTETFHADKPRRTLLSYFFRTNFISRRETKH